MLVGLLAHTSSKGESLRANGQSPPLFYFQHYNRLIIEDLGAGCEVVGCLKDGVHNFLCGTTGMFRDHVLNAGASELFIFCVAGVHNAVTEEDENIAGS